MTAILAYPLLLSTTLSYGCTGDSPASPQEMVCAVDMGFRLTRVLIPFATSPQIIETIPSRLQALEGKTIAL